MRLVLFTTILFCRCTWAQNLLLDGDFTSPFLKDTSLNGWHTCGSKDSPDFFNDSISSSVFVKYRGGTSSFSGASHVGLFVYRKAGNKRTEVREFICGALVQPLKRDSFYTVQVYVKPDEESNVECDGFAIHLSPEKIYNKSTEELYRLPPHIVRAKNDLISSNESWTLIRGNYKARGNEKYIVLGNLKPDNLTITKPLKKNTSTKLNKWPLKQDEQVAYFYVDKASVTINDSLNRLSQLKSEEKKKKKIQEARLRDSLKIVNDSLLRAGKTVTLQSTPNVNALTPIILDSSHFSVGKSVNLPMIQFEINRADFKPEAILQLNELLRVMRKRPNMEVEIRGHTDNSGNIQHNLDLSIARAEAVAKFLKRNGISSKRVQTYGYGSSQPLENNDTEEGRALNRRIEVFILHE